VTSKRNTKGVWSSKRHWPTPVLAERTNGSWLPKSAQKAMQTSRPRSFLEKQNWRRSLRLG
jgi:hypothetical protein